MNVPEFVEYIRGALPPEQFGAVCRMARDGEMGFGAKHTDWGTTDGKG